jgi:hypothetical protein
MNAIDTPKCRASFLTALKATFVETSVSANSLSGNAGTETANTGRIANRQSDTMIFMTEIIPKPIFCRAGRRAVSGNRRIRGFGWSE